jgi:trimethylamine--corrinoid protein Co-methyltransferase
MHLTTLSHEDLNRLHYASLQILRTVGVRVPHPEMLRLFREAGADVDAHTSIVRIPEDLVERCLNSASKQFTLYGRDRDRQARFGQGERSYNSSGGQALWLDDTSSDRRYASLADVAVAARLGDALPGLTIVGAMADPHELPIEWRRVAVAVELVRHTTKPVLFFFHDRASTRYVLEVLLAVAGGADALRRHPPVFLPGADQPARSLRRIDLLFETAAYDLPVPIGPMAQVGAPRRHADRDADAGKRRNPGRRLRDAAHQAACRSAMAASHAFDMRTSQIIFGGPEQALMARRWRRWDNATGCLLCQRRADR